METSSPPQPGMANGSVLGGYSGLGDIYDELKLPDGSTRRHWQNFVRCLDELGVAEFSERWQESRQLIRENGVTYNVYGDPRGLDRPWKLDPIPLVISAQESDYLEKGLVQRARLLEAVLTDLYGPQQLLRESWFPPELVYANPGYLRACRGIQLPGNRFLHLAAADLGRSPDGGIRVLSDRTQAPSGAGYALENRIVLVRMLPEIFRTCKVQRLALFFRTFRETLRSLAPNNRDNPRTVLLTPGPASETYFEHAYLARYLGYTLVEGSDLTVRDNRVFLKLLGGLKRVDVICRRLDDDFCDPLQLRGDSLLGVPGLVQAVRAGNVSVANALGSGLAESSGLIPYLPQLCRHFLGEELLIPSGPTYWCGDGSARSHVLANLNSMVIKSAFPTVRRDPIFPDVLSREQRQQLVDRLQARPWDFVAQERLDLSTTPVLTDHGIRPRHVVVRFYLAATQNSDEWRVTNGEKPTKTPTGQAVSTPAFVLMQGGLTRFTGSADSMVVSLQKGGGSKDTWVLTEGPVPEFSLLRPSGQPVELSRGGNDLPSRAADNLFWLGRYVERAEGMVRLLRGIVVRLTEKSGLAEAPELPVLLRTLTHLTQTLPGFLGKGSEACLAAPEPELLSLIYQRDRVGSLAYNFQSISRAAASVRDRISMDMWRVVTSRQRDFERPTVHATLSEVLDLLNQCVITLAGFGGIAMESMTRGYGWRFLDMGRKLERALHMISLMECTLATVSANETPLLEALLEIADSSMTFRRRYRSDLGPAPVLDLLLADESNPRSLVFQLLALRDLVEQLPKDSSQAGRSSAQRLVLALVTAVQLADIGQLAAANDQGQRPKLSEFFERLEKELPLFAEAVTHHYLSHLQVSRHLGVSE